MKKFLSAALCLLSILSAPSAQAREAVPLINYEDIAINPSSGKQLSKAEVKAAIMLAANTRLPSGGGQTWEMKEIAPGQIVGTLRVRDKHQISINLTYSESKFSVVYKNSENMHYELSKGQQTFPGIYQPHTSSVKNLPENQPLIHPHYNTWVKVLVNSIRREIQKL